MIKRFFNGLLFSTPIISTILENLKSDHPIKGKFDLTKMMGSLLGYFIQFYILYLFAKGIISEEFLKELFKILPR